MNKRTRCTHSPPATGKEELYTLKGSNFGRADATAANQVAGASMRSGTAVLDHSST